MLQRLIIAYAILTIGFTGISFGMIANGSAYPGNPAWPIVTAARNIFLGFGVVFAVGAGLLWLFAEAVEKDWSKPTIPGEEPPKEPTEASREATRIAQEAREKARLAREEEKRKRAEQEAREQKEEKRRHEELQRQAEEKRKLRSAEDAARSGLDDFL